jgi:hypothetical protein
MGWGSTIVIASGVHLDEVANVPFRKTHTVESTITVSHHE